MDNLVHELKKMPEKIHQHRLALLRAQEHLTGAKNALAKKESELLLSGAIDGKNAEMRSAQLQQLTEAERKAVTVAEQVVEEVKAELYHAIDTFNALRSIALVVSVDKEAGLLV